MSMHIKVLFFLAALLFLAHADELSLENNNFEVIYQKEGIDLPSGWNVYKWSKTAAAECRSVKGGISDNYAVIIRPSA
ncbi:MAG TPA: hypothetical protein DC049_00185, partial [Spirochaetia bacterium]|nr:hypothetical protein [Spirochaetia bacterium]